MFCEKCGNELSSGTVFCSKCGNKVGAADSQQSPPQPQPVYQQPVYQQPPPPTYQQQPAYQPPVKVAVPHYAPGGYAERLHSFGGSVLFMVGIILFTAGKLFTTFASFSVWSFFSLMILALPVTGFWLIFAASKMPRLPEKTLTSLTLFKVSIIIDLVVSCIIGLLFVIVSIVLFAGASLDGAFVAVGI
ncbi:MAG: zinc ribbon domain-containing protein, partial [Oscillospiraceae bacterium]|nr:zinc ribbon domain-containing protein [Oscillospiraceae bacterium]